jgi:hypothetical protein
MGDRVLFIVKFTQLTLGLFKKQFPVRLCGIITNNQTCVEPDYRIQDKVFQTAKAGLISAR